MSNKPGEGSAKTYKTYTSTLGDILFPGDGYDETELRSAVGELIHLAGESDLPNDPARLGKYLAVFIPEFARDESIDLYWHQRNVDRWNQLVKPRLAQAIEDYYINGGKEKMASDVQNCLSELESLGMVIDGREAVTARLGRCNWKDNLVRVMLMGRPEGIRFHAPSSCCNTVNQNAAANVLERYNLNQSDIGTFVANVFRG
ncbi:hypothetical protein [Vibrio owensii]|uniref:Uncharacterized protein n=1 Tax=Vibrio owensii CAIM 1854 = LMG 25443 TaxID=1229493 RepID=A0A0C1Z7S2_9VIBR|nr:hypothetical protein [Vibrio owensii]KIF53030.1 hypothetical protein H735_08760 [Vibrio owensii CAIM 1854 = LMG 25443]